MLAWLRGAARPPDRAKPHPSAPVAGEQQERPACGAFSISASDSLNFAAARPGRGTLPVAVLHLACRIRRTPPSRGQRRPKHASSLAMLRRAAHLRSNGPSRPIDKSGASKDPERFGITLPAQSPPDRGDCPGNRRPLTFGRDWVLTGPSRCPIRLPTQIAVQQDLKPKRTERGRTIPRFR